jgi:homocysteine S-methyltransferase
LLACETIPSHVEGAVLGELLVRTNSPSWVCFSCRDGEHISDGTSIEEAVGIFQQHPRVLAVGINCTRPQYVAELIARINAVLPDKAIVVYPNSGETYHADDKSWTGTVTTSDWATSAREWRAAGATIIGGCCRTGPRHIRAISESR